MIGVLAFALLLLAAGGAVRIAAAQDLQISPPQHSPGMPPPRMVEPPSASRPDVVPPAPRPGIVAPPSASRPDVAPPTPRPGIVAPQRTDPAPSRSDYFGAIAFTADGSWATAGRKPSRAEAEADVAKRCSQFGRGGCEIVAFTGDRCVALATFIGRSGGRHWKLSFTAGGSSGPDAQAAAMARCSDDSRTRGQCQLRTMVCGDGR
jgi:Domain of unknown function (DUF4189)